MRLKALNNKKIPLALVLISLLVMVVFPFFFAEAETVEQLEAQIKQQKSQIEKLNREIEEQTKKLNDTTSLVKDLDQAVRNLEATERKLQAQIDRTEKNINTTELEIKKIGLEINDKKARIDLTSEALGKALRNLNEIETISLLETLLAYDDMSEFWNQLHSLNQFQEKVQENIVVLKDLNTDLNNKKEEESREKDGLVVQKTQLSGEREAVKTTKAERAKLLAKTRNQEAEYQRILKEKQAQKKAFEAEMLRIESQIKLLIDPTSYPESKRGILSWPVSSFTISQQFGGTSFAKTNPHVYSRPFHPGTDFAVPTGTQVRAVSNGVVEGAGNTDAYLGCYAWGKWILIKHDNGLSTLYAHLSSIMVSPGDRVNEGQPIALSGNTGISTGPHLHLSLYASQGVKIGKYNSPGSGCTVAGASGPFADLDAYLDPMQYLPGA